MRVFLVANMFSCFYIRKQLDYVKNKWVILHQNGSNSALEEKLATSGETVRKVLSGYCPRRVEEIWRTADRLLALGLTTLLFNLMLAYEEADV